MSLSERPAAHALKLLTGATIYTPTCVGKADLLFGNKIVKILPAGTDTSHFPDIGIQVIDVNGSVIVPGIVDVHVHATGGGGEAGPASRTPESQLDQMIDSGVTTVVGLLGTDSITRTEINLLAKLRGLEDEGMTTFMWGGAYRVPPPTLTGSVQTDIMIVDKIIGFGEIAVSDHRSSAPTFEELARIVADARVAGMLSGKSGKTHFHMGSGKRMLELLWRIVDETEIPITQIYPTHMCGRGEALLHEGVKWVKRGGTIDLTCGDETPEACVFIKENGGDISRITISSDAYGSLPVFDDNGVLVSYDYAKPSAILQDVRDLVKKHGWDIGDAFSLCTSNPGNFLQLKKGELKEGRDADVLVLDQDLNVQYVFSKGEMMKDPTWTKRPMCHL